VYSKLTTGAAAVSVTQEFSRLDIEHTGKHIIWENDYQFVKYSCCIVIDIVPG
jgi:hypothetical protein